MKKTIYVRFDLAGMHKWPKAVREVHFLSYEHRHLFKFKCSAKVTRDDRQLEFFMLQRKIKLWLLDTYWSAEHQMLDFGSMSCEMIAKKILNRFKSLNEVEVSEDGENGAVITR